MGNVHVEARGLSKKEMLKRLAGSDISYVENGHKESGELSKKTLKRIARLEANGKSADNSYKHSTNVIKDKNTIVTDNESYYIGYGDNNKRVRLVIELRDGGFEINEFDIENKVKKYLRVLKTTIERKSNSRNSTEVKVVNIALGSMLTCEAIIAGIQNETNGFTELISEIHTFVILKSETNALDYLKNIRKEIESINHPVAENESRFKKILDFNI